MKTLEQTIHAYQIDLEESIIECDGFTGMLMEWLETNCERWDLGAMNTLYLIHGLLTVGYYIQNTYDGHSTRISLVRFSLLSER